MSLRKSAKSKREKKECGEAIAADKLEKSENNGFSKAYKLKLSFIDNKNFFNRTDVANALIQSDGYLMKAAQILGCSYKKLKEYLAEDTAVEDLVNDYNEYFLDIAEQNLFKLIEKGNLGAIIFFLKCKGKHRGWVEDENKKDQSVKLDQPIVFEYNVFGTRPDNVKLKTIEQVNNGSNGSNGTKMLGEVESTPTSGV